MSTYHLGLTGWPLGHSLSPALHCAALQALELEGEYMLYPISPLDEVECAAGLEQLAQRLRDGSLHGLNVTIPHKQAVLRLVDELTPTAAAVGAVNTLYRRGERLIGDNTDVPGFLGDLRAQLGAHLPELGGCALVLGAGGSARAVVYALASAGWQVVISTRRMQQADELIAAMPAVYRSTRLETCPLLPAELAERLPIDLIVNTTPLGMSPHIDGNPWPGALPFPSSAALYDLVYNPRETSLVRAARAAGLPAVTGLGMLVEQAALAFELWTGRRVERDVMFAAVAA